MALWIDYRVFPSTLALDDRSRAKVKFKRAFQFLQWLIVHRLYGTDVRRPSKSPENTSFEVFLGGSCNPTTWRQELAIPYFRSHSISCYNPQVDCWTPDLVEVEHRAKESASLLFFVIDHDTRSLAAITEVCYLAARGRTIVVVINSMPKQGSETKFMQQKMCSCMDDNHEDYRNACEARRTLRVLLQRLHVPVFHQIRLALEYAVLIVKMNQQSGAPSLGPSILRSKLPFNIHRTQISCCTNESDDDGYGSLLSRSTSSVSCSDFGELAIDQHEDSSRSRLLLPVSIVNRILSNASLDRLCSFVFLSIKNVFLSPVLSTEELADFDPTPKYAFDLYIAAGAHEQCWLNSTIVPLLERSRIHYVRRQSYSEDDPLDTCCDLHTCQQSRLLYYLINGCERLSELATELAFLIGERKHHIIVYLQSKIDDDAASMITQQERQDIERSRKYLADLAQKEQISLYHSRDQSWQHVLSFLI